MATDYLTVEDEYVPADLLLFRRYGFEREGAVEALLEGNHGAADDGPFLKIGRVLAVEVPAPDEKPKVERVLRLWD